MWSASKSSLTSTLPGRACRNALVSALWRYGEEDGARTSVESGGSVPDCDILAGTAVIFSNVAQCDHNTRPSSLPSKMWPASMGRLSSHIADLDSAEVASRAATSASFDVPASSLAL